MKASRAVAKREKQPFIVREVRADMLRPHPEISKGARNLWTTILGMANGKTGEVRHRDHWYDGQDIQKRAEICDRLRKQYVRELVEAGYVHWERPHVLRIIKGRKRWVLGETHYRVFKSPRPHGVSSTVTLENRSRKSPTNLISNPPKANPGSVVVVPCDQGQERENLKNHHPDDAVFRSPLEQARQRLLKTQPPEEAAFIECGLEVIEHRVHDLGIKPASAKYYVSAYENLKASEKDWGLVEWYIQNPASNDHRQKLNALILTAEKESKRTGRPFIEVFHSLRQDPRWHEEFAGEQRPAEVSA